MKKIFIAAALLLFSACTVEPQQNALNGSLHLPLTYENWHAHRYTTRDGLEVCALSTGYNGLLVTVRKTHEGMDALVESNRMMHPGATLTVDAGSKRFETYESYFSAQRSRELVEALAHADKAYLEWSEVNGPAAGQRIRVQNILRLDDFNARLKECRDSL